MNSILLTIFLISVAFVSVVVIATKMAMKREQNIYTNGIEVESVVSKCEHHLNDDHHSRFRCFVRYVGDDGAEHEGLLNVRSNLPVGRKVRIRYIPGMYDEVVFISQEI